MRWLFAILATLACGTTCGDGIDAAPGIVAVLYRSQQVQLDAMPLADPASPRAQLLRQSFDTVVRALPNLPAVDLRIVVGETVAETLHGHIVVANEALADLPERERLFILAHELGHVMLGHWTQLGLLYLKWVPGAVVQHETDAVAALLGRDASAQSYRHEYEADAFGLRTVRALGGSEQDAIAAFIALGARNDTATHPGSRNRVAALRAIDADTLQALAPLAPGH